MGCCWSTEDLDTEIQIDYFALRHNQSSLRKVTEVSIETETEIESDTEVHHV